MILNELFESEVGGETPQETTDDMITRLKKEDKRKPKITLKKINTLRKLREFKRFEELKNKSLVQTMYGGGEDDGGGF